MGIHPKYRMLGICLGCICMQVVHAQQTEQATINFPKTGPNDTITVYLSFLDDGTPVPTSALPDVVVAGKIPKWLKKKQQKYSRLRNAVYVTYPYAQSASQVLNEINFLLVGVDDDQKRKQIIKSKEKELKQAFGDKVTNLSVYQGKVLMKLINRQTGNNCYDILKEYKGGANARLWQTVAFFFGGNLKQPYQPKGEDAEMEFFAKEVESLYYPYGS